MALYRFASKSSTGLVYAGYDPRDQYQDPTDKLSQVRIRANDIVSRLESSGVSVTRVKISMPDE